MPFRRVNRTESYSPSMSVTEPTVDLDTGAHTREQGGVQVITSEVDVCERRSAVGCERRNSNIAKGDIHILLESVS